MRLQPTKGEIKHCQTEYIWNGWFRGFVDKFCDEHGIQKEDAFQHPEVIHECKRVSDW